MAGGALRVYLQLLFCDAALLGVLWGSVYLLGCPAGLGIIWLWLQGLLRFALLHRLILAIPYQEGQPAFKRLAATHCLVGPVFESGHLLYQSYAWVDPLPGPHSWALCSIAALSAYLFWELTFPDVGHEDGKKNKKQESRALFIRVVLYSQPDVLYLGGAFLFLSLAVLFEMFIPYSLGKVIDILGSQYHHDSFLWAISIMGILSMGSSLSSGLRGGLFMCSLARLNKRIRHMLFQNLLRQEIGFFEETKSGDLASRLSSDTNSMGMSVAMNVNVLIRSVVKALGMLALMVGISWQLTLLTCVEMPMLALMQNTYNGYSQALMLELQDCKAQAQAGASSVFGNIRTVRSFNAETSELQRYEEILQKMHNIQTTRGTASAIHTFLRRIVTISVKAAMLFYGRQLISLGFLTTGSLLAFVLYQKDMTTNIKQLLYICGNMLTTVGAAAKVFQYLDRKPKQRESESLQPASLKGHVVFRNVIFSYPLRPDKPALKGVSLELLPGKVTALVGPSGGGKSSCISLLQRFYDPKDGEVLLDGEPLHCYQHQYLHQKISLVSQNPILFSGSIRNNIAYGLEHCSLERVKAAAVKANAHDFISKLEKGYETDVGECGDQLSAGQRQCIAIARALIREPQVLILDEATSSMDANTQQAVQEVLSHEVGKTVLMITHQLKTIERADHIIFIEDGAVKEQGTHEQLTAMGGRYHRMKEKLFDEK